MPSTWLLLSEGRYQQGVCSMADYTVRVYVVDSNTPPVHAGGCDYRLYCVSGAPILIIGDDYELGEEEIEQFIRMGIVKKVAADQDADDCEKFQDDSVLYFTPAIYSGFKLCKLGDVWIGL
jgi:hypothetical protein